MTIWTLTTKYLLMLAVLNDLQITTESSPPSAADIPTFTLFKSDVSVRIPDRHLHLFHFSSPPSSPSFPSSSSSSSGFRIYSRCNLTADVTSRPEDDRRNFPAPSDCLSGVRGVVRANSRMEKFASFPCASLEGAWLYDVFAHVYELEAEVHLTSFLMTWPKIELRVDGSGVYAVPNFLLLLLPRIEKPAHDSCSRSPLPLVRMKLQVHRAGPVPRFEGESRSPVRLVHDERLWVSFDAPESKHELPACLLQRPGLYVVSLEAVNPPSLLNRTEFSVSDPPHVTLSAPSLIGGCLGHVTVELERGKPSCALESDRVRMVARSRTRGGYEFDETYLAERPIRDGRAEFDCDLLEDLEETESLLDSPTVCWKYVSILPGDGSVVERGENCTPWNRSREEDQRNSEWSEWSECRSEGVRVRNRKCQVETSSSSLSSSPSSSLSSSSPCLPAQFVACRSHPTVTAAPTSPPSIGVTKMAPPRVDALTPCSATLTRQEGTIAGSCGCGNSSHWLVKTGKLHPLVEMTFTYLSESFLTGRSTITIRDGANLPTSDMVYRLTPDPTTSTSSFPVEVVPSTGFALVELGFEECLDGANATIGGEPSFVASYRLERKKRLGSSRGGTAGTGSIVPDPSPWTSGDKVAFAAILAAPVSVSLVLIFTAFRRNEFVA